MMWVTYLEEFDSLYSLIIVCEIAMRIQIFRSKILTDGELFHR